MVDLKKDLHKIADSSGRAIPNSTRLEIAGLLAIIITAAIALPMAEAAEPSPGAGWMQIPTDPAGTPVGQAYSRLVYDSVHNVVLLYGGRVGPTSLTTDTWAWDGQQWSHLSQEGPYSLAFALAFDSDRGVAVLYGGGADNGPMEQTWEWDGQEWKQIQHPAGPGARAGCGMAYDPVRKRVVLHGGDRVWAIADMLSDTWEWDGTLWKEIPNAGGPPRARHNMVYDTKRKVMVLFGGLATHGSAPVDTWEFDGHQWQQVATEAEGPPGGRDGSVLAYDSARAVTIMTGGGEFGDLQYFGFAATKVFNDTWEWNGHVWSQVAAEEPRPPAVLAAAAAYDPHRYRLVHFGGTTEDAYNALSLNRDTWEYTGIPQMAPAHGQIDVFRDVNLSWTASPAAGSHNVYFGTSRDAVHDANTSNPLGVLASQGQNATTLDPGRLAFDRTYYWRVDEVNASPDRTLFKGDIWRFTIEPYSIQIPGADIIATASSSSNEFSLPEKTLDGSGLGADGTHSIAPDTMWFTAAVDLAPWIQFEFDGVKQLDTMKVWNSNSAAEMAIGWGVKDVEITYSSDGETWTVLEGATQFSRAPGNPSYNAYDEIAFDGVVAKVVRFNIASNWGGLQMSYSISEVQFAAIPAAARTPEPVSGATDVVPDATLEWRAGREAAEHRIYVGTDANGVADASAPTATSSTPSFDLSSLDLDMGAAYYWRVDEANESEATPVWAGPVWNFSTAAALIVDDFESYGNASPDRPFQTWLDGFGYSADEYFPQGYGGNGTGAGIGYDIWSVSSPHYNGDIMESSITIAGSSKSMPFYFSTSGGVASQTDRVFAAPQDWTVGAAQTLSIAYRGQAGNTGTLFAIINGVKVTYPHDPANIAIAAWQAWNIDLAALNTNLQSVTTFSIGVDGASASGMVLIDDITLHAEPGELITPVQPDDANLILHYTFDEGAGSAIGDSSGNGYSGTFESIPAWATGVSGSAISLDGVGSYVDAPAAAWSSVDTEFTVSFWTKGDATLGNNWGFYAGDTAGRIVSCHAPWGSQVIFDTTAGWNDERVIVDAADDELRGQWRQWTIVRDSVNGIKQLYIDGMPYGSTTPTADPIAGIDRFFIGAGDNADSPYMGLMDDFQIYNRALSAEEVLWNAGVTSPIDKPF
jgi:hypothetical protein